MTIYSESKKAVELLAASGKEMYGLKITDATAKAWAIALNARGIQPSEIAPACAWFLAYEQKFPDPSLFADRVIAMRSRQVAHVQALPEPEQPSKFAGWSIDAVKAHVRKVFDSGNAFEKLSKKKSMPKADINIDDERDRQIAALRGAK